MRNLSSAPLPLEAPLGNDVVDLRDDDTRDGSLHPRFDILAFHPSERAWIGSGPDSNRRRWSLWAAKEAGHKALRQAEPELRFAPRHYHVVLDAAGSGVVTRGSRQVAVQVEADPERIHAVAGVDAPRGVCSESATLEAVGETDPSRAVRRLLARALGTANASLDRVDRIPRLRLDGERVALSLSHHGRFVAYARRGRA